VPEPGEGSSRTGTPGLATAAAAHRYDSRWPQYIRESLRHTFDRIDLQPDQRLLDVGCGTGQLLASAHARAPEARLAGLDPSAAMLDVARRRVPPSTPLIRATAEAIPLRSGSIDWLVITSVLHRVRDPLTARREWRRVLRPGGTLVLTDWCEDFLSMRLQARWSRLTDPAFRHMYSALELQAFLIAGGLDVVQLDRYKINWHWGMMTATAVKRAG
jgi:ubiquinone/menaquinone biosynthesis C-methylase UbiE